MSNEDRRQHARRSITRTVHIATGLGPPLKCGMKDVSEAGARIVVTDSKASPQEFLLLLNAESIDDPSLVARKIAEIRRVSSLHLIILRAVALLVHRTNFKTTTALS